MCLAFLSMALFKYHLNVNTSTASPQQRILGFLLLMGDLFIVAAIVDLVLQRERSLELGRHELHRKGQDLKFSNEGLRERQEITDTLLKLSRSLTTGLSREAFAAIASTIHRLLGSTIAVAMWTLHDKDLTVMDHAGFTTDPSHSIGSPNQNSFARVVTEASKTLAIGNTSLRPDLKLPAGPMGEGFQAVLGSPAEALESKVVGLFVVYSPRVRPWDGNRYIADRIARAAASVSIAATRVCLSKSVTSTREMQTILDTVSLRNRAAGIQRSRRG